MYSSRRIRLENDESSNNNNNNKKRKKKKEAASSAFHAPAEAEKRREIDIYTSS
jgi:hypothetical protein